MPYAVIEFQDTPNPSALKCVLDGPLPAPPGGGLRSYQSLQSAADDPLATTLLSISGVISVLIQPAWITVNKSPTAEWKPLKAAIKKVLHETP